MPQTAKLDYPHDQECQVNGGADGPYEKLKRALRAKINEEAWSALFRTKRQPFPKPFTGRIAVKVINHYGDEVLRVYEVG